MPLGAEEPGSWALPELLTHKIVRENEMSINLSCSLWGQFVLLQSVMRRAGEQERGQNQTLWEQGTLRPTF